MEGASYAMRDSLELIREMGVTIEQVRVSGGGARSALWRQIQADIYGVDVHTVNATEGPAFGVALLAMVGAGVFASVPEACDATIRLVERTRRRSPSVRDFHDRLTRSTGSFTGLTRVVRRRSATSSGADAEPPAADPLAVAQSTPPSVPAARRSPAGPAGLAPVPARSRIAGRAGGRADPGDPRRAGGPEPPAGERRRSTRSRTSRPG